MTRVSALLPSLLLLGGATGAVSPVAGQTAPQVAHESQKSATIAELTDGAERIFHGRVLKVTREKRTAVSSGRKTTLAVRIVKFEVLEALKGASLDSYVKNQEPLTLALNGRPIGSVVVQDELLLYVSAKNDLRLDSLVGPAEGLFKLSPDPENPQERIAINLADNEGLWGAAPGSNLWSQVPLDSFSQLLKESKSSPARRLKILQIASTPNKASAIPLELLKLATRARLRTVLKDDKR